MHVQVKSHLKGAAGAVDNSATRAGWWTVAYSVPATWRKVEDKTNVVVRGWRGRQKFVAVWADGKADCAYWWTREHEAWADLPRELVRWTTPTPTPVKVSFAELKRLITTTAELV